MYREVAGGDSKMNGSGKMGLDRNSSGSMLNMLKATSSNVDSLREYQNKLMEKLKSTANSENAPKENDRSTERKQVIVELTSVGKELQQAIYREKSTRLENQRLKNEEATARTIRARNQARRERERLLMNQSMEKMMAAKSEAGECRAFGGSIDDTSNDLTANYFSDSRRDAVGNNLKEAREYSIEAAAVARRRKADEGKENAEEKEEKRKKNRRINVRI
jgi:hypothetical protein